MGKYTITRTMQQDRARNRTDPTATTFSGSADYLLEVPTNEAQFRAQAFLYGLDPTGIYRGYIDQRDLANYWDDYLRNTGQSWSDIRYPSFMRGYGASGSYSRSVVNFSKNLSRLYR